MVSFSFGCDILVLMLLESKSYLSKFLEVIVNSMLKNLFVNGNCSNDCLDSKLKHNIPGVKIFVLFVCFS